MQNTMDAEMKYALHIEKYMCTSFLYKWSPSWIAYFLLFYFTLCVSTSSLDLFLHGILYKKQRKKQRITIRIGIECFSRSQMQCEKFY